MKVLKAFLKPFEALQKIRTLHAVNTAQKMKKSLMENFIFCAV